MPRFYELDPLRFQGLCRDIYQAEPHVSVAEIFGTPGQLQRGVDIIATLRHHTGVDVGQCKCIEPDSLTVANIRKASTEFLEHLDYWKERGVQRFTLLVAPDASRTEIQDERLQQREAFRKHGIEYELWGESTLANKLRALPSIVATYLGEHWRDILCGTGLSGFPAGSAIIDSLLRAQVESLSIRVTGSAEAELESVRLEWRRGARSKALSGLTGLKESARWSVFPPDLKASIIRFEAQLALENGDLPRATRLSNEAGSLSPEANVRLNALIARASDRYDEALALLEGAGAAESQTLRAALLMERGRTSEAQPILDALSGHAEAHRLRALSFVLSGDMARARLEAQKAVELGPGWLSVLYTRAIVNYLSGLSPSSRPSNIPPWPQPEDWPFVKTDDETAGYLGVAAADIAQIEKQAELTDGERRVYETWHLAALADSPSRRSEAARYCSDVLKRDPGHYRLLLWAVARRLDIGFADSTKVLTERVNAPSAEPAEVTALALLKIRSGDAAEAKTLLETHRSLFLTRGEENLWELWMAQSAAAAGETHLLGEAAPSGRIPETTLAVLTAHVKATHDWEPLIAELARRSADGDGQATFMLCATLAELARWDEASPLAGLVIDRVSTADALSLGCIVLYNARKFEDCLHYLDAHRDWFPRSELPTRFQRLRLACLRELGSLRDAARAAEELLRLEPTTVHFSILADLYFEKGDLQSLVTLLRRHTQFDDLSNEALLRQAMRIAPEHGSVAAELWRRAATRGFPDREVPIALEIGYKLGLDRELRSLVQRLSDLAATPGGPVRRMSLDDVRQLLIERRDNLERVYEMYRAGRIPIHLAAHRLGRPLSFWYHRALLLNGSHSSTGVGPVLTRSGWRAGKSVTLPSEGPTRLHADVTAILLACHLGLLDHIEARFRPIFLPHRFTTAIAALRDQTLVHQPARHLAMRQVHDFIASGVIGKQDLTSQDESVLGISGRQASALRWAQEAQCFVVEFQPFLDSSGQSVPDLGVYLPLVRTPHALVDALYKNGDISAVRRATALEALGPVNGSTDPTEIAASSRLLCASNVLEALASAGVLDAAVAAFRLFVATDDFAESIVPELQAFETSTADATWLGTLLERITRGIDSGAYQVTPDLGAMSGPMADGADESPAIHCLGDLLRFPPTAGDAIWADDRWVTSFVHRDGVPVVDTWDLLEALLGEGVLSSDHLLEALATLRAGDVRFLSLDVAELLPRLRQAPVTDGRVSETRDLRTLRKSYACTLLEGEMLRVTPDVPEAALEWTFLLRSGSAVVNAVVESWAGKDDLDSSRARAEWLLRSLYTPDRGRHLTSTSHDATLDRQLESVALSGLLSHAITFGVDAASRDRRKAYLDWIYLRLLRRRFQADAALKTQTLSVFKTLILDAANEARQRTEHRRLASAIVHALLADLPDELRRPLEEDDEFISKLGIKGRETIHVGPHRIVSADLWKAAAEAFRSSAPIEISAGSHRLTVMAVHDQKESHLIVEDSPATMHYVLFLGVLGILSDSVGDRETALKAVADQFDLPPSARADGIARVAGLAGVDERVRELARLRSNSAAHDYFELDEKLRGRRPIEESDLIPEDAARLLRHLRVRDGEALDGAGLDHIVALLITELGIEGAFDRLAGIPSPISAVFLEHLARLSAQERRHTLKRLLRIAGRSPVGRAHVARLIAHFVTDYPAYHRYIQRVALSSVRSTDDVGFRAWREVLKVCADGLFHIASFRQLSTETKLNLIWTHGDRVFRTLAGAGVELTWIEQHLGDWSDKLGADVAFAADETMIDVAYPRRLRRLTFALATTAYSSEGGLLLDESTRDALTAFVEANPSCLVEVMQDLDAAQDATASIVTHGIKGLSALMPQVYTQFSAHVLRPQVQSALEAIRSGHGDLAAWSVLQGVVGDNAMHSDLAPALREALLVLDLPALYVTDPRASLMAVTLAAQHAGRLGHDVVERVRAQVVLLTQAWSKASGVTDVEIQHATDLISSAAFYLFCRGATDAESFRDAARLLREVLSIWPALRERLRMGVDRLVEGLPNADSRWFWALQIKLRVTG